MQFLDAGLFSPKLGPANLRLQLRLIGSKPAGESSRSSGGDMTPPGLELNQS
jgi:hypothetical protein